MKEGKGRFCCDFGKLAIDSQVIAWYQEKERKPRKRGRIGREGEGRNKRKKVRQ